MWSRKILILFFILISITGIIKAQQTPVKKDSTQLYTNIKSYSERNKFNTFIYRLFFKPLAGSSKKGVQKKSYKKLIQKPYSDFQGKIIRNINIVTLDPFGYSVTDTTAASKNRLIIAANNAHIKTQIMTIRNLLLIHKNEPFNSFYAKESERLIRKQKFVHDVSFYVGFVGGKSDSVDVYIRELDTWSLYPLAAVSTSHIKIGFLEKNFLGTGHEFKNIFSRNMTTGINAFNTDYFIPSIRTTYINSRLRYGIDGYGNVRRSIYFDRPFYSPYAKWAAGISLASQIKKDSLTNVNPFYIPLNLKFKTQDFWAGKAIQILKGYSEDEVATNLIFSVRYMRIRYQEKPSDINDPATIYANEDLFLAGIGISTRKYVQDKYIFRFGIIEDVPVGKVFELTGGYQLRNNLRRPYMGIRVSFGNYNEWGYLSTSINFGTFLNSSKKEQGVLTAGVNYFTGLFEIGKWKFRQFVKPQVTIGMNRFSYDSLTINGKLGLDGFNSTSLSGTKRMLLTLQTQSYPPWNLIGFNFGPFLNLSFGMLGDAVSGFKNKKIYPQIGFGVLIKNENLVFNTFQVSISFFPSIPGHGQNIFKTDSFRTVDFGFQDFEIGKPVIVPFR